MKIPSILFAGAICALAAEPSAILNTPKAGIYGEPMKWHRITLAFEGPECSEKGDANPFLDFRLTVTFTHSPSGKTLVIPGYFAADGHAGETGADSGNIWRAHFSPAEAGEWAYSAEESSASAYQG